MSDERIETDLKTIGEGLHRQPSVRDAVMRRVTEAALNPPARQRRPVRRGRLFGRLAAVAACALIGAVLWTILPGGAGGGLGAQQAFAAAIANLEKARTFSTHKVNRYIEDGQPKSTEVDVMFREPDRERVAYVKGLPQEVTITDYKARRQLQLFGETKTAEIQDISTLYDVDDKTGRVKQAELFTRERDQVLKITAQAVKDVGMQQLDGQEVRVLRSDDAGEPVKTVWVNPKSGKPVQIELSWPSSKSTYTFTSIRIDEDLDEALFSLDPPAGYALAPQHKDERPREIEELDGKMLAKARKLVMACIMYSNEKGEFPADVADLKGVTMDEAALRAILAAPDRPNGAPVLVYRKPRKDADAGTEIVVYEAPGHRRSGKVIVGFQDGHSQICNEDEFNKLMK